MRHEGRGEHTGSVLSNEAMALANDRLQHGNGRPTFARNFAYISGPAWDLLPDELAPKWKATIAQPDADLSDLIPLRPARTSEPAQHNGDTIAREEGDYATRSKQMIDDATQRTSVANGLHLPLAKIQLDFDPSRVMPLPDARRSTT